MGGRRRRRKVVKRVVRRTPKVFKCPRCDNISVTVIEDEENPEQVVVLCSVCGLKAKFNKVKKYENVHYYNKFVDCYYMGEVSEAGEASEGGEVPE
ncbi:MAG: hypothetical protein DRJ68_01605 [Thermoprotei archaeon]|nr:MAG: hypothetical protein DRJ62_00255 [Thermoprotei archaeon]RLF22364.1 MAG: hypothetical protein DRJ68_01605 [Thermoprotei archaeon]